MSTTIDLPPWQSVPYEPPPKHACDELGCTGEYAQACYARRCKELDVQDDENYMTWAERKRLQRG